MNINKTYLKSIVPEEAYVEQGKQEGKNATKR